MSAASAIVLSAGFGTRMRPFTDHTPKPLIKVGGRAMLDRLLDSLASAGIGSAVVNVHYLADQIEAHVAGRPLPRVIISDERARILDSGGGVAKALPNLCDPFVILNGDSFWIESGVSNLTRALSAFDPARMDMLLLLSTRERAIGFDWAGDFFLETDGRLKRRGEAPQAPYAYMGVAVASRAQFEGWDGEPFSLNRLWNDALARGRLFGQVLEGDWYHIGTPQALREAEDRLTGA